MGARSRERLCWTCRRVGGVVCDEREANEKETGVLRSIDMVFVFIQDAFKNVSQ